MADVLTDEERRNLMFWRSMSNSGGVIEDRGLRLLFTALDRIVAVLDTVESSGNDLSSFDLSSLGRNQLEKLVRSQRKDYAELQAERDRLSALHGEMVERYHEASKEQMLLSDRVGMWERACAQRDDNIVNQMATIKRTMEECDRYIARVKLLEKRCDESVAKLTGRDDG